MKDKQYLVSEEELRKLFWVAYNNGQEKNNCKPVTTVKDFLKSKQPVDTLDRDKVIELIEGCCYGEAEQVDKWLIDQICNLIPKQQSWNEDKVRVIKDTNKRIKHFKECLQGKETAHECHKQFIEECERELKYFTDVVSQLSAQPSGEVIADVEVTGIAFWSKGNGKTKALILHTTNGDIKVGDLYMDKALEYVGNHYQLVLRNINP